MNIIYLIYILSGVFIKPIFIYYNINLPIDITLLTGFFLIVDLLIEIIKNRFKIKISQNRINIILILILFYIFMIFTLFYTKSEVFSLQKTLLFLTSIIAFIYPILKKGFNLDKFLKHLIITSLLGASWFVLHYSLWLTSNNLINIENFKLIKSQYLSIAYVLGILIILLFNKSLLLFSNKNTKIFILLLLIILLISTGGRGPLLAVILTIFIKFIFNLHKKMTFKINMKPLINFFILIQIPIILIIFFFNRQISTLIHSSINRLSYFLAFFESNKSLGNSINSRIELMSFGIQKIFDNPINFIFGYGVGSFGVLYDGIDKQNSPHNLFIELFFEFGLIGFLLFLTFLYLLFQKTNKNNKITIFIFVYIFLNFIYGGTIIGLRIVFAFLCLYLIPKKISNNSLDI